jgi:hypothetical protein
MGSSEILSSGKNLEKISFEEFLDIQFGNNIPILMNKLYFTLSRENHPHFK